MVSASLPKHRLPRAVTRELERYVKRVKTGRWKFHLGHPTVDDRDKLPILLEEIGEVGTAVHNKDDENLKEELAQVAALALAWLAAKEETTGSTRKRAKAHG